MSPKFPLAALALPLAEPERAQLSTGLSGLLAWQRELRVWPLLEQAPDATPIVSLYARGALAGCAGIGDGAPAERLARAFVAALGDVRFGGLDAEARAELVAQVSYPLCPFNVELDRVESLIEVGRHGASVVRNDGLHFTLLPDVARDHHLTPSEFLDALAQKAGLERAAWPAGGLFLFETERVIARGSLASVASETPRELALRWLSSCVGRSGAVRFGIDPRAGAELDDGPMHLGRAAIALRALDAHPAGQSAASRARRWLSRQIGDALAGRKVPGWPAERPLALGTLALASLAGIEVDARLEELAREPILEPEPWHAAQVAAALGVRTPAAVWQACERALGNGAWAPWTAIAAQRRGDTAAFARAIRALVDFVRDDAPYAGGVGPGAVPEVARSAATVEALRLSDEPDAKRAVERARSFILREQLNLETYPLSRDPAWSLGAFPVSPVYDFLQTDVTAHALLAL